MTMKLALARCAVATRQLCDIYDEHTVYVYDCSLSGFKKPTTSSTTSSALQAADIDTKAFTILAEWIRACKLINHLDPARF